MDDKKNKIRFIQKLAYCLHSYGAPCYRIEAACLEVSKRLGFSEKSGFFSTPTSIMSTYIDEKFDEESRLMRVEPSSVNLKKLTEADRIGDHVINFNYTAAEGHQKLNELIEIDDDNRKLKILSYGILSSNFTLFLNGSFVDIIAAFFIGAMVGILTSREKNNNLKYLSEGYAAFVATLISYSLTYINPNINPPLISLSSLIVLLPGLNLTISISELASNNLTSGTGRLVGAIMVLMKLAFGVYVATEIMHELNFPDFNEIEIKHSFWIKLAFFPLAALGFTASFKAAMKDYKWIFLIGTISILASYYSALYKGQIFGTFIGALVVTTVSNIISKKLNKPVLLTLLPGIIVLVPGSLGYESISLFFYSDTIQGMELAFTVTKIAMALVAGLFFGNVIVNPRRNI